MMKNSPKTKNKNYIRHMPYLRNSIYDHDFWCTYVKLYLHAFFHFFKFFIFQIVSGVYKRGKIAQNEKIILPVAFRISEPYIGLSFMVHLRGVMISLGDFLIKWQNILSVMLHILQTMHHMISAANKGWSTVNYQQSLAFEHPYLSCNNHCDWKFSKKSFFY